MNKPFLTPIVLLPALLAGCLETSLQATAFQLDRVGLSASAPVAVVPAADVAAPVAGPVGEVTVDLSSLRARLQRRLLWAATDVEKVKLTIRNASFTVDATVLKADIIAGKASHTFTGVPVGPIEVMIEILGSNDVVLGGSRHTVTVVANQTTSFQPTLSLSPTRVEAPSGGGGDTTPQFGGLGIDVTLQDGGEAAPWQAHATIFMMAGREVTVDAEDNVWVYAEFMNNFQLQKISPGGTVLGSANFPIVGGPGSRLRFDASGRTWLGVNGGKQKRFTANVTLDSETPYNADDVVFATNGDVWAYHDGALTKYDSNDTLIATYSVPNAAQHWGRLERDAAGNVFVLTWQPLGNTTTDRAYTLTKFSPDGQVLATYVRPWTAGLSATVTQIYTDFRLDAQGKIWLLDQQESRLIQFGNDLALLQEVPTYNNPSALDIGVDGTLWVFGGGSYLGHLSATGTALGSGTVPDGSNGGFTSSLAADSTGKVWIYVAGAGLQRVSLQAL